MTTNTDALASPHGTPSRRSPFAVISDHPILFGLAVALGAALVAGALYLVRAFAGSEEATIRVRNGSLQFITDHPAHRWTPSGASGNYRYQDGAKRSDDYEVTVVAAGSHTCALNTKIGANIEFTYIDDTDKANKKDMKINVQSQGRNTFVKPGSGVILQWNGATPRMLRYEPEGYLARIVVDNQTLCSFTEASQLSSVLIMDVE
jgi:hypothetical protein